MGLSNFSYDGHIHVIMIRRKIERISANTTVIAGGPVGWPSVGSGVARESLGRQKSASRRPL